MKVKRGFLLCVLILIAAVLAQAQVNARMFRQPDVSDSLITFVYAGDIWVVDKDGGLAHRLSSPKGEESFPRFSPDGSWIAFSGNYDGNTDVYIVPSKGGLPKRLTYHPMSDRVIDWHPLEDRLLFASGRESGRQRFNQIFSVTTKGGLPDKLPIPYGEFGALSPDGKSLAYTPLSRAFRNWKRYRGGWASEIWLFDLEARSARNLTNNDAVDDHPMWHGRILYFLSDRGPSKRQNIWKYDLDSDNFKQVTQFKDFDVSFPAIGPKDIVFEAGGRLYLMNLETEKTSEVKIEIVTDLATLKPRLQKVGNLIEQAGISPSGKRAVFEARGEVFTVPAENGFVRNLTQSSSAADRNPAWSPNGKHIAFWSDESGEYELILRNADGTGQPQKLTKLGKGYRHRLFWSSDSQRIAFIDNTQTIRILDISSGDLTEIDTLNWMTDPALASFSLSWSQEGFWITYAKILDNFQSAVFVYNTKTKKLSQVTSGYYSDSSPVFDPEGKYLYFLTNRTLSPLYGDLDGTWIYPNSTRVAAVSLRKDVPSPLAPRNDSEPVKESGEKKQGEEKVEEDKKPDQKKGAADKTEKPKSEPLKIDLDGFESRIIILPPQAGNYRGLAAVKGQVIYHRFPRSGSGDRRSPIMTYDLEKREEVPIVDTASGFEISADGKKMLVSNNRSFYIIDLKPKQKLAKKLATDDLEMTVDPRAEWRQMFMDVWRNYRDLFYDPGMHGLDWEGMRRQYGALLRDAVTRWDVNFVIGELIAELNASHTYIGGGEMEKASRLNVGMLGVDWSLENGAYRIARILDGAPWDSEVRSPLKRPGVKVNAGDYVLAVNGRALDPTKDPWAAFAGLGGKTVSLTVNNNPGVLGSREVLVDLMSSETRLRHLEWIESNRRRVEEASAGRVGYIYMPNTGGQGQTELIRQYYGQLDREGFIVDERFNSGGQLADRFVELLSRPRVHYIAWRYGKESPQPTQANPGPKVMLINGWSVSGGDAFPYTFKSQKVGPIVGTRTTGGLIGPAIGHSLVDGGFYTVPEGRIYSNSGEWFPEGHGVEPDIEVIDDPAQLARGIDPQLERAIQEAVRLIEANPPKKVKKPAYTKR